MAVWEHKGGRWVYIFELEQPGKLSEQQLDKIFAPPTSSRRPCAGA